MYVRVIVTLTRDPYSTPSSLFWSLSRLRLFSVRDPSKRFHSERRLRIASGRRWSPCCKPRDRYVRFACDRPCCDLRGVTLCIESIFWGGCAGNCSLRLCRVLISLCFAVLCCALFCFVLLCFCRPPSLLA